jgi:hypothetical protein
MRDRLILSLFLCRFSIFEVCLLKERAYFRTCMFPIQILVCILTNVTSGWDSGIRMRDAFMVGILSSCVNSTVVSHAISGRKREIAGVKVGPFLQVLISMCYKR